MIKVQSLFFVSECFQLGEASLYTGTKSTTVSGLECQRWDKQTPHEHDNVKENFPERSLCRAKNYCRDPGNDGMLYLPHPGGSESDRHVPPE